MKKLVLLLVAVSLVGCGLPKPSGDNNVDAINYNNEAVLLEKEAGANMADDMDMNDENMEDGMDANVNANTDANADELPEVVNPVELPDDLEAALQAEMDAQEAEMDAQAELEAQQQADSAAIENELQDQPIIIIE